MPPSRRVDYFDITHHLDIRTTDDPEAMKKLDEILRRLGLIEKSIKQGDEALMADLSALEREVQENSDAVASATSLMEGLSEQLRQAAGDPAAIQALADELDANTQALAEAVVANTPQA
jgi:chromosome segregation ATPase